MYWKVILIDFIGVVIEVLKLTINPSFHYCKDLSEFLRDIRMVNYNDIFSSKLFMYL